MSFPIGLIVVCQLTIQNGLFTKETQRMGKVLISNEESSVVEFQVPKGYTVYISNTLCHPLKGCTKTKGVCK
jgi:hypothetical protein